MALMSATTISTLPAERFFDVLVEIGVLGAAGVGKIYLQQPVGVIPKFAPQDILLYQLCRGVEHAGMLPDLNAFYASASSFWTVEIAL